MLPVPGRSIDLLACRSSVGPSSPRCRDVCRRKETCGFLRFVTPANTCAVTRTPRILPRAGSLHGRRGIFYCDCYAQYCANQLLQPFPRRLRPSSLDRRSVASYVQHKIPIAIHRPACRRRVAAWCCVLPTAETWGFRQSFNQASPQRMPGAHKRESRATRAGERQADSAAQRKARTIGIIGRLHLIEKPDV